MKLGKISLLPVIAMALSTIAILFSAVTLWKSKKYFVGTVPVASQKRQASEEPTKRIEPAIQDVCWDGDPEFCRATAWEWSGYTLRLGDEDKDHEIRHLVIRDGSGKTVKVGQLPENLTYVSARSEMDGGPINHSPTDFSQGGNSEFRIEVFFNIPIDLFEYRLPVLVKYIYPPEEWE